MKDTPEWLERAERIQEELEGARFGERGAVFVRHSMFTGYAVSSLKRELAAARFLGQVESERPQLAANLRKLGSNAVAELGRMFRDDPQLAERKAQAAAEGRLAERAILRDKTGGGREGRGVTVSRRGQEFVRYISENGVRLGISQRIEPPVPGPLAAFEMQRGGIGCAAFIAGTGGAIERLDSRLALMLYYDMLFLGMEVSPYYRWKERLRLVNYRAARLGYIARLGLFVQSEDGFEQFEF